MSDLINNNMTEYPLNLTNSFMSIFDTASISLKLSDIDPFAGEPKGTVTDRFSGFTIQGRGIFDTGSTPNSVLRTGGVTKRPGET